MLKKITALRGSEPVVLILFPVIGALVAYGVQRGVVTGDLAPYLLSVLAVVLGVPVTAAIRSQVTPASKVPEVVTARVGEVIEGAADTLGEQLGPDSRKVVDALVAQTQVYAGRHRGL